MSDIWYYTDAAGVQVGPVTAADIRGALANGRATGASLAWREGMAGWLPISQLDAELGNANPYGIPPPPQAPPTLELAPMPPDTPRPMGWNEANPYRAPEASVEVRSTSNDIVYAGFVRRWAAFTLDSLVLGIPIVILALVLGMATTGGDLLSSSQSSTFQAWYYLIIFVVKPLYYAGMESSASQATLGKMALGIKVTDESGHRLSFGHALGRWFASALSYITLYIGFLMAAFTDRKRALHDMVASTLVVDKWAYTEYPDRQKRGLSGCLIVFLIAMLMVPILAILAAIAISQYQDYVRRAQQAQGSVPDISTPTVAMASPRTTQADWSRHYDWS
jgi:uncharacterized RDD family membrane protein YckC